MEEKQEQPKGGKKPSLLWPLLLWPLVGVPVFWGFLWLFTILPHTHGDIDLGPAIYSLMATPIVCFGIGAVIGFRFGQRTTDNRNPWADAIACGLGATLLGLAYNFGGCMLAAGVSSAFR